jgi:hypothetical protein
MIDAYDSQPARREQPDRPAPAVLVAAAIAIRIGILAAMPDSFVADPDNYRAVALNMVEHGCFGYGDQPIASRPVLYPLVVAACRLIDPDLWYSLAIVHVALGVMTVVLTWRLGLLWGVGKWSFVAAALVAVDPILLAHSTLVMTETLATFLAAAGLLAATRCARQPSTLRAARAGAIMALAVLCRPTFLVWMGLAMLLLPLADGSWRTRVKLVVAGVLAAAVILSPWAIRNALHFGKATLTTNHGGYTLLLANNPGFYQHLRTARPREVWDAAQFNQDWRARAQELAPGNEVAADRLAYADALVVIRNEPRTFAYSCLVRVGQLWTLLPHRTSESESPLRRMARWAVAAFYSLESLLAVIGVVCLFRGRVPRDLVLRGWIWGLLLAATFTAIHTFYWTNIRMRAPVVPVVCIAAALGASRISQRQVRPEQG